MLRISSTRLIIATINVQNRNKVSQVMYIGITSLCSRKAKNKNRFDFLGNEEATATVNGVPSGISATLSIPHLFFIVNICDTVFILYSVYLYDGKII